jgi:protein SCO1
MKRLIILMLSLILVALPQRANASQSWTSQGPVVPMVKLIDQDGRSWRLDELIDERPVVINFFFTGCRAICPTQIVQMDKFLSELNNKPQSGLKPLLLSISLDPLGDTPETIRAFIEQFGIKAGPEDNWLFLSGSFENLEPVWRAFQQPVNEPGQHDQMLWIGLPRQKLWTRAGGLSPEGEIANLLLSTGD